MARTKNKARKASAQPGGQRLSTERSTGGAGTGFGAPTHDEVGSLTVEAIHAHDQETLAELAATPGLGIKEDPLFGGPDEDDAVGDQQMGDSISAGAEDEDELDALEVDLLESEDSGAALSDGDETHENGVEGFAIEKFVGVHDKAVNVNAAMGSEIIAEESKEEGIFEAGDAQEKEIGSEEPKEEKVLEKPGAFKDKKVVVQGSEPDKVLEAIGAAGNLSAVESKQEETMQTCDTSGIVSAIKKEEKGAADSAQEKDIEVSASKEKGSSVEEAKQDQAMEMCDKTGPVNACKGDINAGDTKASDAVKMDVVDSAGPENAPDPGISELRRRQLRARKRNREVAFEYWNWGPAPANLKAAKAAAKELVEQNMYVQWKCELCNFSACSGEEIDNHLGLLKHEKVLAEHLRVAVLPLRRPEMLEIRKNRKAQMELAKLSAKRMKELRSAKRAGAEIDLPDLPVAKERKVVKRCELCNRDFISLDGYDGHIKGQKHMRKEAQAQAQASTCNDDFVN